MPSLTPVAVARDLIRESIDPAKAAHLYNQALYLVGANPSTFVTAESGDELPIYPSLTLRQLEVGRSRQLLSDVHIVISRLLSSNVGFKVKGVRKEIEEVMRQYWRRRVEGSGTADGGWLEELREAGRDGNALGLGVIQIGLETDHNSRFQKTTVEYVQPWYFISDASHRNVMRSPFVCFIKHYSVRDAKRLYGKKAELHAQDVRDHHSQKCRQVVRVYEYYDCGLDCEYNSTKICIVGNLESDLTFREENVFGCLPFAACLGWQATVLGQTYGRVLHSIGTQEMLHRMERRIQAMVENGSTIDVIDVKGVEDQDAQLIGSGAPYVKLRRKGGSVNSGPLVERISAAEVSQTDMSYTTMLRSQLVSESNISEVDRGISRSKRQTATEIDTQVQTAEANRGFEAMQQALFIKRLIERVLQIAKKFDRAPFSVEIYGEEIEFNSPEHPASWLDEVLNQNYIIHLDTDALSANDDRYKKAMDLAGLRELWPLIQSGQISLEEFAARTLDILGESENFKLQTAQPTMPEPQQQGGQARMEDIARQALRGAV